MGGVEIEELGVRYGSTVVVEGFSLRVAPGECGQVPGSGVAILR